MLQAAVANVKASSQPAGATQQDVKSASKTSGSLADASASVLRAGYSAASGTGALLVQPVSAAPLDKAADEHETHDATTSASLAASSAGLFSTGFSTAASAAAALVQPQPVSGQPGSTTPAQEPSQTPGTAADAGAAKEDSRPRRLPSVTQLLPLSARLAAAGRSTSQSHHIGLQAAGSKSLEQSRREARSEGGIEIGRRQNSTETNRRQNSTEISRPQSSTGTERAENQIIPALATLLKASSEVINQTLQALQHVQATSSAAAKPADDTSVSNRLAEAPAPSPEESPGPSASPSPTPSPEPSSSPGSPAPEPDLNLTHVLKNWANMSSMPPNTAAINSSFMQQPPPGTHASTTRALINITLLKPQDPAVLISSTNVTDVTNITTDVEAASPANVTSTAAALPAAEAVLNRWWYLLGLGLFVILIGKH